MAVVDNPWIVRRPSSQRPALRMFCLPHAGAGGVIYRDWFSAFAAVDVCAIEPPGRFARLREQPHRDLMEFVHALGNAIEPLLDIPFVFFGYSLGALMSFECARLLRRRHGLVPQKVIFAAAKAPHLPRRLPAIAHAPDHEFIAELEQRYGAFEPLLKADPDMFSAIRNMMRADLTMLENYQFTEEAPLGCPLVAIGGTEDPSVRREELEAWRAHTSDRFRALTLPGAHFFLRTSGPQLRSVVLEELDALRMAATAESAAQ